MNAALELRGLACQRGERMLFSGLSVAVRGGQLLRVQGANGAGKTSLLRTLCGLMMPTQGEVLWQGRNIAAEREAFGHQLAYLGHTAALKGDLSALENLRAAASIAGVACSASDAAGALAQAGLRGREHLPARMLSQGQRQRAALARLALPQRSALWVLDEPFNALDTLATAWLLALVGAQLRGGGTVVLTSHQSVSLDGLGTPAVVDL